MEANINVLPTNGAGWVEENEKGTWPKCFLVLLINPNIFKGNEIVKKEVYVRIEFLMAWD